MSRRGGWGCRHGDEQLPWGSRRWGCSLDLEVSRRRGDERPRRPAGQRRAPQRRGCRHRFRVRVVGNFYLDEDKMRDNFLILTFF
jgi:hypothetical protein